MIAYIVNTDYCINNTVKDNERLTYQSSNHLPVTKCHYPNVLFPASTAFTNVILLIMMVNLFLITEIVYYMNIVFQLND